MACILLHNICIHQNDPCKPRWQLEVKELNLIRGCGQVVVAEGVRGIISNWLWALSKERNARL